MHKLFGVLVFFCSSKSYRIAYQNTRFSVVVFKLFSIVSNGARMQLLNNVLVFKIFAAVPNRYKNQQNARFSIHVFICNLDNSVDNNDFRMSSVISCIINIINITSCSKYMHMACLRIYVIKLYNKKTSVHRNIS